MEQIKFDKTQRYKNKSGNLYGKGVWYRDSNNNGRYDAGDILIRVGNRIKNSDGSYVQLNSDGSNSVLFKNGKASKGISNTDKQAMANGLIYGTKAVQSGNKFSRINYGNRTWDIDTNRIKQNGNYVDSNGNYIKNNQIFLGSTNKQLNAKPIIFTESGNQNSKLITQRTEDSPIGQYINPDTKQKTNYVRVNFGDTNGQNQYLRGNYWVYDDGNGNIQTIGFRNNGKDYAFITSNSNGTASFLNTNTKGTIIKSPSIASSKLTSYASGFTPGMSQWRGKAGWYTNVGNKLPNNVAGAKNGYLYDKQGKMIGFNADGNYYILKTSVQPTHFGEAANTFVSGWKGLGNDLVNLYNRNLTPTDMLGGLGDIGRGVQHLAQGTIGAATEALLPDEVTNTVGKYGQILDPGKVISGVAHGKAPWDNSNHGLVDFDPGNQSLQDINDILNGAAIIFGTKGAGGAKGAVKAAVRNSKTAAKIADAATAAKAATKAGFTEVKDIYRNGARKQFVNLPKPGTQLYTKAGLRPSNIVPMGEAFKKGFQDTYKSVYDQAKLNRIPQNERFTRVHSGEVITPKRPKSTSTVKNSQEVKTINPELLPSVGPQNFTRIPNNQIISIPKPVVGLPSVGPQNFARISSGDIISINKPIITTPATIPNTQNFIRVSSGPLYYAAKPEPLALPHLQPRSISWNDAIRETKRNINNSSKKVNNIQLPPIQQFYSKPNINIKSESQINKGFRQETPTITENLQIETPKTISWQDAKNAYKESIYNSKKQQNRHNTKPSKRKLLKKRKYNH